MAVVLTVWVAPARGAAGETDPSFSGDGRVAVVPPSDGTFVARAVALQPDGRIVIAGFSCAPSGGSDGTCLSGGGSNFRIARLTADGGLDAEWGNGGFVTTPIGTRSQAYDVTVLGDGSIVAGGLARVDGRDRFALARYDSKGYLVDGFGDGGKATFAVGTDFAAIASLAPGPGGTLYAAGQAVDAGNARRIAVARVTNAGQLDATWGSAGTRIVGPDYGYGLGTTVGSDGGVLIAGVGGGSQTPSGFRFGLTRLDGSGAPDRTFNGTGWATFAPGTSDSFANALLGTPGDGFLAAGVATGSDNRQAMALLRGTRNGALDPGFGAGGVALVSAGDGAAANDAVALPDGRFVAVGQVAAGGGYRFGAARLRPAGALDGSFGDGGVATIAWDRYPVARATAGAVQPDGRLVSVGIGCAGSNQPDCTGGTSVLLAARQLADPPAPVTPVPPPAATPAPPVTPAVPTPQTPRRPSVRVAKLPGRITRARLVRHGLRVRVRTSAKVRAQATLTGRRRTGKHRSFVLARANVRKYQRSYALSLKPGRRAARTARRGAMKLQLRVQTAAGARVTRTFTIRLR